MRRVSRGALLQSAHHAAAPPHLPANAVTSIVTRLGARQRAARRWYVYLILCRGNAIYTGIALDVAARYAQHVAGTGARYTRANPPCRLLTKFACPNQSVAARLEAAIKRLPPAGKRKLVGTTGAAARKLLLES